MEAILLLKKYLDTNWDDQDLDKIQSLITQKANDSKVNTIVFGSVFAALFIPFWSVYLDKALESDSTLNIVAMKLFLLITMTSILLVMSNDLVDNVITRFMALNKLNEDITEVRIMNEEIRN